MGSRDGSKPGPVIGWTRDQVDAIISRLLRFGLIASAALVFAGAVRKWGRPGVEVEQVSETRQQRHQHGQERGRDVNR